MARRPDKQRASGIKGGCALLYPPHNMTDIIVFLVAHKEFKALTYREDKVILDFAGVFKECPSVSK